MINVHMVLDYFTYWIAFWTVVNILLPPREIFDKTPSWYNTLLKLVAYYGALNLRQVSVKLYSAVNQVPLDTPQQTLDKAAAASKDAVSAAKDAASAVGVAKKAVDKLED